MVRKAVACVSDSKYLKYSIPFLKSLYTTNPDLPVHLKLVDCAPGDYQKCQQANSNVIITPTDINKSRKPRYPAYPKEYQSYKYTNKTEAKEFYCRPGPTNIMERIRLYSDLSLYCIYAKYVNARALQNIYDKVLILDVDALVKKDLTPLFDILDNCDVASKQEEFSVFEHLIFNEGVTGLKTNDRTKQFLENIIEFYREHGLVNHNFQSDQLFFREEYYEQNIGISFHNLPNKFKDETFKDDSFIWSGCGDRKKDLPI